MMKLAGETARSLELGKSEEWEEQRRGVLG